MIEAQITDGDFLPRVESIQLLTNGVAAAPSITRVGAVTTVRLVPDGQWPFGTTFNVSLSFYDNANPSNTISKQWQFSTIGPVPVIPVA